MSLLHSIWDTTVEDKERLEEDFLAHLREMGYPDGSLFRGPSFNLKLRSQKRATFQHLFGNALFATAHNGLSCYTDLGILDLETNEYAALIEFRLHLDGDVETRLATVFEAILHDLPTRPAVYLVTPGAESGFTIYQLLETGQWRERPAKDFPAYGTLDGIYTAARKFREESLHARSADRFTLTCRLLAVMVGILTLSSIITVRLMNTTHILLLLLAAALLVTPETLGLRTPSSPNRPRLLRIK